MPPSSYLQSIKTETLVSGGSGTMNAHTITDVIIALAIFLALIISFSVLAWRCLGCTALPAPSVATPVTTHGRSFLYLTRLQDISLVIHDWWTRASHNRIDRIPSITNPHYDHPVARALSVRAPPLGSTHASIRTPTPTAVAPTSSGGASTIDTFVGNEVIELCELDGVKSPNTSSVPETDDVDITSVQHMEPVV